MDEAFFTVHRDLPRQGPGCAVDVQWAVSELGLSGPLRVFEGGCGPGADLEALAEALPKAQIRGVEMVPHFVDEARARVARFGARVVVEQADMADPGGPYDLIWCAGALYFLGVTEGLQGWRSALAPGGHVVFSEPVLLGEKTPMVQAFWEEYPQITDLDGIMARVHAAGYRTLGHRMIVGAPWAAYYDPMQARLAQLRAQRPEPGLSAAIDAAQREIDLWSAAPDQIAYALIITAPE